MTIVIEWLNFEWPYGSIEDLKEQSWVYCILTKNVAGTYNLIDCGEAWWIKDRIKAHDRQDCWNRKKIDWIFAAVYYCNESTRMDLEKLIRSKRNWLCWKI